MQSMVIFTLSLLAVFTTNHLGVTGLSMRQRVTIVENKVSSLEILTSTVTEDIADVNATMLTMCAVDGRGVHVTKPERQHVPTEPVYDPREFNARLVQAFQDEKEFVRKQEKHISDKTDEFLKTVMEKVTQHEQRVTDISNEFLNEFNEKVAETSMLTDGMEKRLNKADADIVQLYNSTAALKVAVKTHTSSLTNHIETRLKSAEDEITSLRQTSDALLTAVKSLNQSLSETSSVLTTAVRSLNQSLIAMFDKVQKQVQKDVENPASALLTTTTHTALQCPGGWEIFGLFCYKYFNSRETFAEARKICATHNAHVVDVASQAEMDFIMGLVTSSSSKSIWLGLTDSEREGTWKWDRTGAVATYLNWRPGQPDSLQGRNQECVIAGNGRPYDLWNDIQCSYEYRFVCKSSLV